MKPWYLSAAFALPLLAMAPAPAAAAACSNANLVGKYGVATHGLRIGVFDKASPPAIHFLTSPLRTDLVTLETFDGSINATMTEYVFFNGSDLTHGFVGPGVGTYHVSRDCTGTEDITFSSGSTLQRAFVLSREGRTIHMLWTAFHTPSLPASALPPDVTCAPPDGCDLAVQFHSDGERF